MDYRIARSANIALGAASFGLETYAYFSSAWTSAYEISFMSVTGFYILEAIVFLIAEICWRVFSSFILIGVASLLIWSTVDIENEKCTTDGCQEFEIKLAAASAAIANGFFYLLAKPKRAVPPAPQQVHVYNYADPNGFRQEMPPKMPQGYGVPPGYPQQSQMPRQMSPPPFYEQDLEPDFHEEPLPIQLPPVFTVPRAHIANTGSTAGQGQGSTNLYPALQTNPANSRPPYRTNSFQRHY